MNYELALESMMEDSFGRIFLRPTPSDEGAQSRDSADRAADKTEPEDEKRAHCRAAVAISNANRISNRCTIFPANSPIAAAGASLPPQGSATNSESGDLRGFNELSRNSQPDASEEAFQGVSLPPFFFSCRISQPATADFDNQQRSEGKRHEHPSGTDNWTSTNERVH